jgi:hypothetical protein
MTRIFAFSLSLCLLTVTLVGQAPVPRALLDAKTAYLANEGVKGDTFDRLATELQHWKRFTLVDAEPKADVVIAIKHPIGMGGAYLSVRSTADHSTLWGENAGVSWSESTMAAKLVKRLRAAIDSGSEK